MKIVFIGNHSVSFSTETHHRKTIEKLGHTVIQIQENKSSVQEVLNVLHGADMLYWTHTHSFHLDTKENIWNMLQVCKAANIPTVGYHLDLWLGLEREKDLHTDPYWNIQHFFTVDKLFASWLNENTATKGYYLPAGVFEDEAVMGVADRNKYPHDIVFTGSKRYHPEFSYRPKLIDWLHNIYGNKFAHYGDGGLPKIRGMELNNLYASAKIVIGDTLCKDFTYPAYFSDRLFESTGRGGFLIFPYIQGIEDSFEIGKEIIVYQFDNFFQLKSLIDHFISSDNDSERETIRIAGHNRAKRDHTYTKRIQSLLKTLNLGQTFSAI